METNSYIYMQNRSPAEAENPISLLRDVDGIDSLVGDLQQDQKTDSAAESRARQSLNPRIQFLRLSAIVRGRQGVGILGATPPYQPVPPSLYRSLPSDHEQDLETRSEHRALSPLRNIVFSRYPPVHDSQQRSFVRSPNTFTGLQRVPLSRTVKMPQTGFQALILCGPGIGLSTFTSVPAEFPKALVEVANRPMVWYVLDWCYRMGVTDITLITPPTSKDPIAAALAQNPYLTSLPSPTPDLLAPEELEFTTPTAELLRLPEVQEIIKSDFLLLPCDLICAVPGEAFLETYLTRLGGPGGIGTSTGGDHETSRNELLALGGESRGRRGGLSIWYNTIDREESVKGEECDFMCTTKLDAEHDIPLSKTAFAQTQGVLRKLVWTMPMSELWDQCEEDKSWKIRQSLLRKHGAIKCMTKYRDSHIYLFPHWVKDFAKLNEDFESVSEDLVGTWAKSEWRKPSYRARFGARKIFSRKMTAEQNAVPSHERPIEEEIDLLSLSSTQITSQPPTESAPTPRIARLASRVPTDLEDSILSPTDTTQAAEETGPVPLVPPILSYILPSTPNAPLVRRVDATPLLLSVSLALAKLPSIEESLAARTPASPFAHQSKVHPTTTIAPRVTISRSDTLIDSNSTIATQCVIKSSVLGASVAIGTGTRITGCVIMDGVTIGDKCVLTNTVVGKKAKVGNKCTLVNCEVQDGNVVTDGTEGKGEKYLVGGLEDEMEDEEGMGFDDDADDDAGDAEGIEI
ncbi:Translation initiation factor eIF-2B subunit gamma [Exophiala dermatitidis]|uniref:Translation initiation factor eIF2B subunit gamma n=2 Tax=Exophiala dermatitidis TaxID=5970 RepID=H6C8G4_EXODN|nr:translation initiation factor eIF-2B gamma subunit [Exophiala dermatitidis NIH/UT8656]KAJ4523504.1 Translation initiation factor eIF-2B subunit gamma [Exophiala dermatitidis]EHY60391.1 translation initiation factor eIF-2B gamma subunit [Exophiala dermatitidis NIH/UT8656]KAJ4524544.1 Translation initiation factor eIF-2B subunit gamma [Exophiala dermatitidis]KAJ4527398.1 Translation initiation factor eIF-2B subunit gamma [Exophiala dermatitidis]KAJ4530961.1 Translation initiation factor eIF-2